MLSVPQHTQHRVRSPGALGASQSARGCHRVPHQEQCASAQLPASAWEGEPARPQASTLNAVLGALDMPSHQNSPAPQAAGAAAMCHCAAVRHQRQRQVHTGVPAGAAGRLVYVRMHAQAGRWGGGRETDHGFICIWPRSHGVWEAMRVHAPHALLHAAHRPGGWASPRWCRPTRSAT